VAPGVASAEARLAAMLLLAKGFAREDVYNDNLNIVTASAANRLGQGGIVVKGLNNCLDL